VAKSGGPTISKRQKERQRAEKREIKERKKADRKAASAAAREAAIAAHKDPDLIDVIPSPADAEERS